jgi:hypothetical protein
MGLLLTDEMERTGVIDPAPLFAPQQSRDYNLGAIRGRTDWTQDEAPQPAWRPAGSAAPPPPSEATGGGGRGRGSQGRRLRPRRLATAYPSLASRRTSLII